MTSTNEVSRVYYVIFFLLGIVLGICIMLGIQMMLEDDSFLFC